MQRPDILSAGQAQRVVDEAFRLLAEIGVRVEDEPTVDRLRGAGATIDTRGRICLPRNLVESCIESAPRSFQVYDREGDSALTIGGDDLHFVPGSAATQVLDHDERVIRTANTSDTIDFVTVTDSLPGLALQSTGVVPGDVDVRVSDRFRLFLALVFGRKPIVSGTFSDDGGDVVYDLLCAVRGSANALRDRPLAILDCCSTSPLSWSARSARDLAACATNGIPAEIVPAPLIGATSPATRMGTLIQQVAECLSGVVIHQLARPGAPVVFGAAAASFDMRTGTAAMAAPDAVAVSSACAQIARHICLPAHAYLGLSDAKTPDYQSGMEVMAGALCAQRCGVNIAAGAGLLNYVNCQSLEKLFLDQEAYSEALALRRVHTTDTLEEELPETDELRTCVESGNFLTSAHTRRRFRTALYFPSAVVDRSSQDSWENEGSVDAATRAHTCVLGALEGADKHIPPQGLVNRLDEIITSDAERHGICFLPDWRARL
jgi:trimethylamine--corrinoid protein Co-methyltransferase